MIQIKWSRLDDPDLMMIHIKWWSSSDEPVVMMMQIHDKEEEVTWRLEDKEDLKKKMTWRLKDEEDLKTKKTWRWRDDPVDAKKKISAENYVERKTS